MFLYYIFVLSDFFSVKILINSYFNYFGMANMQPDAELDILLYGPNMIKMGMQYAPNIALAQCRMA